MIGPLLAGILGYLSCIGVASDYGWWPVVCDIALAWCVGNCVIMTLAGWAVGFKHRIKSYYALFTLGALVYVVVQMAHGA